jgi:PPK2 family polyphosphate:nucleotide phosphotransferase
MFKAIETPYLVTPGKPFKIQKQPTSPPKKAPSKEVCEALLQELVKELSELQQILYAHDSHSILLIFQAMDSAGKDGTIRAILSGVNPAGCQVFSFKQPNSNELEHDFLWRTAKSLPERGRIGVFNRSYYEEVLVVKVHPEYLASQRIEVPKKLDSLWKHRYQSIRDHEKHLARNGTVVLKFWLNVSKDEQRQRFLSRLEEPEKHWKFSEGDVKERGHWGDYMDAYETALTETSKPWAPWYAIPADDKDFMRLEVARTVVDSLKTLDMHYPIVEKADLERFDSYKELLRKS